MKQPLPIFRPGKRTALSGEVYAFSADDLAGIAARYDAALHRAPLVKGHPKTDDPAFGHAASAVFSDPYLSITHDKVDPAFADEVDAGRWLAISPAFYHPDQPNNPTPGQWYLNLERAIHHEVHEGTRRKTMRN
jgi:hypothetical protein